MKLPWFKRAGIFFIPVNIAGWIIFMITVIFIIYKFMAIDSRSHSVSDTLINFFFFLLIIGAVYSLVAFLTGNKSRKDGNQTD